MKASSCHIETIQMICRANQLIGLYERGRDPYNIFGSIVRKHREYLHLFFPCFLELGSSKLSNDHSFSTRVCVCVCVCVCVYGLTILKLLG